MKFSSPKKNPPSRNTLTRKHNTKVHPATSNEFVKSNSHLVTLVVAEVHIERNDILPLFQKLYRTRNRVCHTKLCNKIDCIAFWRSHELILQVDSVDLYQLPPWMQHARKLQTGCVDIKSPHVINFLVKNICLTDTVIQPAWLRLNKMPAICIPSNLVVSSDISIGPPSHPHTKISRLGPSLLDKYTPNRSSLCHIIFFRENDIRIIIPQSDLTELWGLLIARMPNLQVIESTEDRLKFRRKVAVRAKLVKPEAQLTDTTSGIEIGHVVDSGNTDQDGWALILEDFSQDQCVMVNKGSTTALTAFIEAP